MKRLILALMFCSGIAVSQTVPFTASLVPETDLGFDLGAHNLYWDSTFSRILLLSGNATIGGTLNVDSIIVALRLTSNLTVDGQATLDTINGTIVFTGPATVNGTLSIDSILTALRLTSDLTVDGTISVDSIIAALRLTSNLTVDGTTTLDTIVTGFRSLAHSIVEDSLTVGDPDGPSAGVWRILEGSGYVARILHSNAADVDITLPGATTTLAGMGITNSGDFTASGDVTGDSLRIGSGFVFGTATTIVLSTSDYSSQISLNVGNFRPTTGFDNAVNLGVSSARWKDINMGGNINIDKTGSTASVILETNTSGNANVAARDGATNKFIWGWDRTADTWRINTQSINNAFVFSQGGSLTLSGSLSATDATLSGSLYAADTVMAGPNDGGSPFSYITPGGALVQSSDSTLKTNVSLFQPNLANFSTVRPKRWQYKRENFLRTFDEASVPDSVDVEERVDDTTTTTIRVSNKTVKDSTRTRFYADMNARADKLASAEHSGFMAQDFNPLIMGRESKEINWGEVVATLWLKVREQESALKLLEARVKKLEGR